MKTGTYHHTAETLEKIRESNRRRIITPQMRENMRKAAIGKHPKDGALNPMWKGGRKVRADGYILVRLYPNHPFYGLANKSGYAMEHRIIMAEYLGRMLEPFPIEIVDHKNGQMGDNRIENLTLKTHSEHITQHNVRRDYGRRKHN